MDAADIIPTYIEAGLPVLPLHAILDGRCSCRRDCGKNAAKHPITRHGKDDATTDPTTVAAWLARYPWCNWGIRPPVGVAILDVDVRNGGPAELARLESANHALPPTLEARTGSGGRHIWLSHNGPARGKLCAGVDVKTHSGYVVAPPSIHACGGVYEWADRSPAAYAPRWVADILNPPIRRVYPGRPTPGGIDGLVRYVAALPEGMRNDHLFWAACTALREGHDPTPLIDAAVSAGLTAMAATATVRSATRTVSTGAVAA
jgi:Bifunctional DNA primase/polymerase, N-terminal